jgi:hypothetical protein
MSRTNDYNKAPAFLVTIGLYVGLLGFACQANAGPCDRLPAGKELNDCLAKQWKDFNDHNKMNNPPASNPGVSDNNAKAQNPVSVPSGPTAPNYNAYQACVRAHEASIGTVNAEARCDLDGKFH